MEIVYKKLNEDDILEILIEHFQVGELANCCQAKACLLGEPGNNMRFVAVFSNEMNKIEIDLNKVDSEINYNGTHECLKTHPEFHLNSKIDNDVD
jgi:hypothetical protein